jgi:antitoxin (DNA-binding transcriptional repressor) of toxin-antitoxin stability system
VRYRSPLQERYRLRLSIPIPGIAFAFAFAIAGLMLLPPRTAFAQASAGITGTITDPSGAVVSGASVTITNEGTSVSDHTVTESAGMRCRSFRSVRFWRQLPVSRQPAGRAAGAAGRGQTYTVGGGSS